MKTAFLILCAMLLAVVATAGGSAAQTTQDDELASPKLRITWPEFKKLYDKKKVVVIDVRGDDAYAAGHIPGARSIPLAEIESHADELKKLKKPIVVYCA